MQPMKANDRVEEPAIDTARQRKTEMDQANPLEALNREKNGTHGPGIREEVNQLFPIVEPHSLQTHSHGQCAAQQNQRVDSCYGYRKTRLKRRRPNRGAQTKYDVRTDQAGKKHRLRAQENKNGKPGITADL